jgi:hypothetical protein
MWDLSQHDGAVTLDGSGTRVDGSVYAPDADLTVDAAPIDGQIIAGNLDLRGGEAHAYFFAGALPCGTTTEPTGSISLTKTVTGDAADTVPGSTEYTVDYATTAGENGTLELQAGTEQVIDELPAGTEVVLTERDLPQVDGLQWEAPEWQVDGETVAGSSVTVEAGTDVEVVLVNTATDDPADDPAEEPAPEPTDETSPSPEPGEPGPTAPGDSATTDPTEPTGDGATDVPADSDRPQHPGGVTTGDELPVTGPQVAGAVLLALALVGSGVLIVMRRRHT